MSIIDPLPFQTMIGHPFSASVQAMAASALKAVDFIQQVGCTTDGTTEPPVTDELGVIRSALQTRSVMFSFLKTDVDGVVRRFALSVPLLTIIRVPSVSVKRFEMKLHARVVDTVRENRQQSSDVRLSLLNQPQGRDITLRMLPVSTNPAARQASTGRRIEAVVTAEKGALPPGIARLNELLEPIERTLPSDNQDIQT